jgi:hypothetical protein
MRGSAVPLRAERANMDIPPFRATVTRDPAVPGHVERGGVTAECMPMTGHGRLVAARFFGSGADSADDAKLRSCLSSLVRRTDGLMERLLPWHILILGMECRGYAGCSRTGRRPRKR